MAGFGIVSEPLASQMERMTQSLKAAENRVRSTAQGLKLETLESLQSFLRQYIFLVWGESHLVRTLEERLASGRGPWVPPQDPLLARRIRELTLEEESGEVDNEVFLSRFDLYISALDELKAETSAVDLFLHRLALTGNVEVSLKDLLIPEATQKLIIWFQHSSKGSSLEIASRLFGLRRLFWFADAEVLAKRLSADYHVPLATLQILIQRESFLKRNWTAFSPLLLDRLAQEPGDWQSSGDAATEALRQVQSWLSEVVLMANTGSLGSTD